MVIVHTYVPARDGGRFTKECAYHMTLSLLLAKEHYDVVKLYTTNQISEIVKKIGLPYDEIITEPFTDLKSNTFSVPKLITYSLQNEPFLHIDLDTLLYDKVDIPKNFNIVYHSPSFYFKRPTSHDEMRLLYDVYLKGFFEIENNLSDEFKKQIDFTSIPGMDIFGGTDYETISEASKLCLNIYKENREHFDSNYYYACVIEQLFIPAAIKLVRKGRFTEINYLKKENETLTINQTKKEITYPLIMNYGESKIRIPNEVELYGYSNHDFNQHIHLGAWKSFDGIMFMIKETIIERFRGVRMVIKIEELFNEELSFMDLSIRYRRHNNKNLM
jgi:hypothetical protein